MIAKQNTRSVSVALMALTMAVCSCILFHTDIRLNQAGIGSPLDLGDTLSGKVALWLQPWLLFYGYLGSLLSLSFDLGQFAAVGVCSGVVLAAITGCAVRRWQNLFWPVLILFGILTIATAGYAVRNFSILEDVRSRVHHE